MSDNGWSLRGALEALGIVNPSRDPVKQYSVIKGDTYSQIAKDNNLSLNQLYSYNGLDPKTVDPTKLQVGVPLNLNDPKASLAPVGDGSLMDDPSTNGGINMNNLSMYGKGLMSLIGAYQGHQMYKLGKDMYHHQVGVDNFNMGLAEKNANSGIQSLADYRTSRGGSSGTLNGLTVGDYKIQKYPQDNTVQV